MIALAGGNYSRDWSWRARSAVKWHCANGAGNAQCRRESEALGTVSKPIAETVRLKIVNEQIRQPTALALGYTGRPYENVRFTSLMPRLLVWLGLLYAARRNRDSASSDLFAVWQWRYAGCWAAGLLFIWREADDFTNMVSDAGRRRKTSDPRPGR